MADLFGVMLKIPQLKRQLQEIGGDGFDHTHLSNITRDWVNGVRLEEIAKIYFTKNNEDSETKAFTDACKAIYRAIVNNGTWGVSALSRVSGMDFERMTEVERRRINTLPAMIYHGVRTEDTVLMRMNSAPRSIAEKLGDLYRDAFEGDDRRYSVREARTFLKNMSSKDWSQVRPESTALSGSDYKKYGRYLLESALKMEKKAKSRL